MDKRNNIIERYVYDVTRRLPEKEREEVSLELNANIYDMLPDNARQDEIEAVLYELGAPASLAEKYRQNPRYLISPAIYDSYIYTLKTVLIIVACVTAVIGVILSIVETSGAGETNAAVFVANALAQGFSFSLSATMQAFLWTTIGFVIAERTGYSKKHSGEWSLKDLPEIPVSEKAGISLADSIVELVLTVVFSIIGIIFFSGRLPFVFIIQEGNILVENFFSSSFAAACIAAIIVGALFSIYECIVKIKDRRWTLHVCLATVIGNLVSIAIAVYLFTRPTILSNEFRAFIAAKEWAKFDLLRFLGEPVESPFFLVICIIIVVSAIAGIINAVYKTVKETNRA